MPVLTLQPDATAGIDTWLASNVPTNNFGVSANIVIGRDSSGNQRTGLLKFDLSSLPGGAIVTQAILSLNFSAAAGTQDVIFYRCLLAWNEGGANNASGTANWNNRQLGVGWNTVGARGSGTDRAAVATGTMTNPGVGVSTVNVTADILAWLAGDVNNGWQIDYSDNTGTSKLKTADSSDNATAGNRPKLDITYYLGFVQHVMRGVGRGIYAGAR